MDSLVQAFYHCVGPVVIAYARIAPVFYLLPFLNDRAIVSEMLKNTLIFAVIFGLWQSIAHSNVQGVLLEVAMTEGVVGLILGVLLSLPFWVATAVGELIDNQRGATVAESIDPATGIAASAFTPFLSLFYAAIFLQQHGMLAIVDALESSYALIPTGGLLKVDLLRVGALLNEVIAHGIALAAPVLIVMFLTDALLALLSRFCAQLNAFALSLTVKSIVAFSVFQLYGIYAIPHELNAFQALHSLLGVMR